MMMIVGTMIGVWRYVCIAMSLYICICRSA